MSKNIKMEVWEMIVKMLIVLNYLMRNFLIC
jgi:hypothetical protein